MLLDKDTRGILTLSMPMHELLEHDVVHVAAIDEASDESLQHMKALVWLRPTPDSLRALRKELEAPKYGEYHLFFTNILAHEALAAIAAADVDSRVKQVHEKYADFYGISSQAFHLNAGGSLSLSLPKERWSRGERITFNRNVAGVLAACLAFKIRPVVRYAGSSALAQEVAREVDHTMKTERTLFTFRQPARAPQLLLLDRRDDPATPLLSQWTYIAMVHELLGAAMGRVELDAGASHAQQKEVQLSTVSDEFFREHMFANFGDMGQAVRSLLEEYQSARTSAGNIQSLEDMRSFLDSYPELRARDAAVGRHVAIMSELSQRVDQRQLFEVSALEQRIVAEHSPNDHAAELMEMVNSPSVTQVDGLRLVMLYALRYETAAPEKVEQVKRALMAAKGLSAGDLAMVDVMLRYGGVGARAGDLFSNKSTTAKLASSLRRGLRGVDNVYTQHEPAFKALVEDAAKGTLSKALFPSTGHATQDGAPGVLLVFVLGGITYEEVGAVAALNARLQAAKSPTRVLLGGSSLLNSQAFMAELARLAGTVSVGMS